MKCPRVTALTAASICLGGCLGMYSALNSLERENIQIIAMCGGGIDTRAGLRGGLAGSLKEAKEHGSVNLSVDASIDNWVHATVFEKFPDAKAAEFAEIMRIYDGCVARERLSRGRPEIDPQFAQLRERTQSLWNEYAENRRLHHTMPVSDADKYAEMGQTLKFIPAANLDSKSGVMKTQRQALMFSIAVEIITASRQRIPSDSAKALKYAEEAYAAAKMTRELQGTMRRLFPTQYWEWENREHVNYLNLTYVSDALAQLVYLRNEPEDRVALEDVLRELPCDIIESKKLAMEPTYRRIAVPRRFRECRVA